MATELAAGVSSSRVVEAKRITTYGFVVVEDTTEGVPTTEGQVPGNLTCQLVECQCFAP